MFIKEYLSMNKRESFQVDFLRNGWVLPFWKSEKPTFHAIPGNFDIFAILFFSSLGRSASALGCFAFSTKNWLRNIYLTTHKQNVHFNIYWPHGLEWPWAETRSLKVWEGIYLEVYQTRFMPFHRYCFKLMPLQLVCPMKPTISENLIGIWRDVFTDAEIKFRNIFRKLILGAKKCFGSRIDPRGAG